MTATVEPCIRRGNLTTWTNCTCPPCTAGRNRLSKLARNGRFHRVPSEQGMAVLHRMIAAGMTAPAIADATGVSENTASNWLAKIRTGKTFRLGPAACHLLVNAKTPTDGYVGTTGPRRMLQALARIGWSCDELTRRVREHGHTVGGNTLHAVRTGKTERVRAWLANDITELYRALQWTTGQSDQSIRIAIANNWASPLAWEDDTIHDPATRPVGLVTTADPPAIIDESRIQRRIDGDRTVRLHKGESAEVVRRMLANGFTGRQINRRTGIKTERYTPQIRAEEQQARDEWVAA